MNKLFQITFILVMAAPLTVLAQQIITIESKITGTQEQPRVISIVPWQGVNEPEYIGEEMELEMVVDVFKPLERESFKRELNYLTATRK